MDDTGIKAKPLYWLVAGYLENLPTWMLNGLGVNFYLAAPRR